MRGRHGARMVAGTLVLLLVASFGSALTLKIGTLAPAGSPWVDSLKRLAGEWERISGGQVKLRVYAGGVAGEEEDMVRKMRIGQLHGAALTQLGLAEFDPGVLALSVPFMIQGKGELDYVLDRMRPHFEAQMAEKGYRLLALLGAGWVHFFATEKVVVPDDLRAMKLGVPAGDEDFVAAWVKMGFDAVSLPIADLMAGLQTGMVEAFYTPLLAAVSFQWFVAARHMTAMGVAPVVTGIIIGQRYLDQIPEDLRASLLSRIGSLEDELNAQMEELETEALRAMQARGLIVDEVPSEWLDQWKELGRQGGQEIVGKSFPVSVYEMLREIQGEYRRSSP